MCDDKFLESIKLFNNGKYYDAHHTLESLWSKSSGEKKVFYQGIIQVYVALHLYEEKRFLGALKVFKRAKSNLEKLKSRFCDIDVSNLLLELDLIFMDINYPQNRVIDLLIKIESP